jgi:hypothetical protein
MSPPPIGSFSGGNVVKHAIHNHVNVARMHLIDENLEPIEFVQALRRVVVVSMFNREESERIIAPTKFDAGQAVDDMNSTVLISNC